eukprot:1042993-Amorphochlora_amoeboformis.AAC.1
MIGEREEIERDKRERQRERERERERERDTGERYGREKAILSLDWDLGENVEYYGQAPNSPTPKRDNSIANSNLLLNPNPNPKP